MKPLIFALMGALICLDAFADDRDLVLSALEGYEWSPAVAAERAGPDAEAGLLAVARDQTLPALFRARAVATLAYYPSEAVLALYREKLGSIEPATARRRAAEALCQGFAETRPLDVERALVPLLGAADPHLRVRVAKCLDGPRFPGAKPALEAYRQNLATSWEMKAVGRQGDVP